MESKDLAKVWNAPDNSKLTKKQTSIRLPILVAAKIEALCLMFPRKTKTELIGDLLATALEQMEKGLPMTRGRAFSEDDSLYCGEGPRATFLSNTEAFLRTFEKDAGTTEPTPFSKTIICDENGDEAEINPW